MPITNTKHFETKGSGKYLVPELEGILQYYSVRRLLTSTGHLVLLQKGI
jgi:hypothetical protein